MSKARNLADLLEADGDVKSGNLDNATSTVDGATDTNITSVADNDLLAYDSTSSKWINQSASEAGIITNLADDTTPQLGGDLDLNSSDITGTGNVNITGTVTATSFSGDGSSLTGVEAFPSGTLMLFQQTAAPTGWTKQTTHNDKALRVVSGTASSGGSSAFSTALATPAVSDISLSGDPAVGNLAVSVSGNISNHTLSLNEIPSHKHTVGRGSPSGNSNTAFNAAIAAGANLSSVNTGNKGGSGSHNHGHNLSGTLSGAPSAGNLAVSSGTATINVQYVDLIIAAKD